MKKSDIQQQGEEMSRQIITEIGQTAFAEMQFKTYLFRTLTSVFNTSSFELKVVAEDIFQNFEGQIPRDLVLIIVTDMMPYILEEQNGFILDGQLTQEAIEISLHHNQHFSQSPQIH